MAEATGPLRAPANDGAADIRVRSASTNGDAVPVPLLLQRAAANRASRFATDATRYAAQVLEGLAHDVACACDDSTIDHLREWVAATEGASA